MLLAQSSRLPLRLKDVLHPDDALQAAALGVAQVIRRLRDELEIAMALTGCCTLANIGAGPLWVD